MTTKQLIKQNEEAIRQADRLLKRDEPAPLKAVVFSLSVLFCLGSLGYGLASVDRPVALTVCLLAACGFGWVAAKSQEWTL